jgi:superfamily II DNA or RNA helicase
MQFLVEQTTSNGTVLVITEKAPQKSSTLYVFAINDSLLQTFLAHTKERPGALDPVNKTFVSNLTILLSIFPTEKSLWFLDYLMDIMPLKADVSSNTINSWIVAIEKYNNTQSKASLKITKEIEYLKSLATHAQTVFENKLSTKNKKVLEEEMGLIDKVTPGAGVPITTSIEMDPTLRGNLAEVIGKKYDAHLMRSSKTNEDKLYSFFLHEGIHEWISKVSPITAGRPELATRLSKGAITLILNEAKVPVINTTSMTVQEVVEQLSRGDISMGELDSRMKERALAYIKDKDMVIPNVKNSFYQTLYKALEGIAKRCKTTLTGQDGDAWQNKLNTLASEVQSQIKSPNNVTVKKIVNALATCFISESDYKSSKEMENANIKSEDRTSFRLDDWQNALVESILSGESVIAVGPTSGGKTLTSMVALDRLFRQDKEKTLIYVAPNFYQALQAYCSMVKSFPKQTFGLITGSININPRDCKYWVGTPEHLWTFARAGNMKFNIGIMDEIHTISSPDTATLENKRKAVCLAKLIGLIQNQFVGLSATIHPDDEERLALHVEKILFDSGVKLKVEFGLGGNKIKRFIPLVNEVFTGEDILPVAEAKTSKTIRVTPENTFKLMKMLSDKQMTPSLVFDMDEKASYTLFSSLVKYLSDRHQNEYVTWRNINNNFEKEITSINKEILTNPEGDKYERLRQKRNTLLIKIMDYISTQIRLALGIKPAVTPSGNEEEPVKIWPGSSRPRRKRVTIEEDEIKTTSPIEGEKVDSSKSVAGLNMIEVDESLRIMAPSLILGQPFALPAMIPQEVSDLYSELRVLKLELAKAELRPIPEVCSGIGSYFSFAKKKKNNVFRQLYNHDKTQITKEDETAYNMIAALSDAEGVKFEDVKQIFKLMDVALSFGIGILIPTMPFCVQFQIMKMLNDGDITIVFASESLSMGVNFPARSCVVRTLQNGAADITKVLQMGGRAGRRGVTSDGKQDKEAYSITWNISNASDVDLAQKNSSTMPRLVLDLENIKDKGPEVVVKNHRMTAMEINMIMNSAASIEDLKIATERLEKTTARLGRGQKFISEDDENKMAAKEAVGKKSKIETYEEEEEEETKSTKTVKKEVFSKDSSVVTSIEKCITILGRDLSFSSDIISKLNKRVEYIKSNVVNAEMLDEPYEWAERINIVKQALQEVHTGLYTRKCVALLNYISVLYKLIHRISMKYIGLVYQKDSTRSM